ncbi:MAG TPA: hypothetical protein VMV14_10820 [Acidimicrobiales bacterium]|nr:hypothetical protein [Acidimicrobiales bacterium]
MVVGPFAPALLKVHPIERLRYVARSGWAGPSDLGAEAAWALADLAQHEPAAVLPACRRLLERNPACGPLWWVAARMLDAGDLVSAAERCADELDDDPTDELLEKALARGARVVRHGGVAEVTAADIVLIETQAMGPTGMVVDGDLVGLLEAASAAGTDVWVEAGTGRVLPARLWEALADRLPRSVTVSDLSGVTRVAGPSGVRPLAEALASSGCPEPPELTGRW